MIRLLNNQLEENKENPDSSGADEVNRTISMISNVVKYLGKSKLELEQDKDNKVEDEMSEYEVHL